MKPFLTIDETHIDSNLPVASRDGYSLREAARAVVFDENKAIALLHVTSEEYYKLPGAVSKKPRTSMRHWHASSRKKSAATPKSSPTLARFRNTVTTGT